MRKSGLLLIVMMTPLVSVACQRAPAPTDPEAEKAALRAALEKYLSERAGLNLPAMDIELTDVKVEGATAEAQVEFRTRDGQGAMQMTYTFDRQGDTWVVRSGRSSGMSTHPDAGAPAGSQMPPDHPPMPAPEKSPPPDLR